MKQPGIYYNPELETIIIGYLKPAKYRDQLNGRVIGHTGRSAEDYFFRAYNTGYEYNDWTGFIYIGRYTTFTTLNGYLNFLNQATTEQIESYFKIKSVVESYMKSYVVVRKRNGYAWFERLYHN